MSENIYISCNSRAERYIRDIVWLFFPAPLPFLRIAYDTYIVYLKYKAKHCNLSKVYLRQG